ncbi:hypothetical protein CPB83DRAFT_697189 [Crepidotus variabilis]|uniref:DUF6534 domain-containing protein n=1 Tax=Crepidotus variabilis TaxID=179855 RepID=A0A9P6E675_9AGAR|nr:hypothetical protein CPB83DRAFT_697189 [Crepidotus variabilis]
MKQRSGVPTEEKLSMGEYSIGEKTSSLMELARSAKKLHTRTVPISSPLLVHIHAMCSGQRVGQINLIIPEVAHNDANAVIPLPVNLPSYTETCQDPNYPVKIKPTYAGIYGSILCANLIALCLYGMGALMVLQYFGRHATHDTALIKMIIMVLVGVSTLQTIFSSHQIYDAFITKHGDLALLDQIVFSVPGIWLCSYFSAFVAQSFFCSRIWHVGSRMKNRARFFIIPALLLSLLQLGTGTAQASIMYIDKTYSKLSMNTTLLIQTTAIQGVATALSDIIISATLCYIFNANRSPMGRTNSMINKLITYTINRALATSFCAVSSVILFYFCSGTYYFMIPLFATTHFYLISAI